MSTNTGGPAFPGTEIVEYGSGPRAEHHVGMTLRDYFAAKAMEPAMLMAWADLEYTPQNDLSIIQNNARLAYQIADAMLAARGAP